MVINDEAYAYAKPTHGLSYPRKLGMFILLEAARVTDITVINTQACLFSLLERYVTYQCSVATISFAANGI